MITPRLNRRRRHRGVGLVELLVSLVIAAGLLTAVAVALDASFKAYQINQEQASMQQRARLALHRITTTIRQTSEHAPSDVTAAAQFTAGVNVTSNSISMYDDQDRLVVYRYVPLTRELRVAFNGTEHILLREVDNFAVTFEPMRSATSFRTGGGFDLLKRASITLTIRTSSATSSGSETTGRMTQTLSASVMPRKNAW